MIVSCSTLRIAHSVSAFIYFVVSATCKCSWIDSHPGTQHGNITFSTLFSSCLTNIPWAFSVNWYILLYPTDKLMSLYSRRNNYRKDVQISKIWGDWFPRRGPTSIRHRLFTVLSRQNEPVLTKYSRLKNETYLQIFMGTDTWVSKGGVLSVQSAPMLSFALMLDYPHGTTCVAVIAPVSATYITSWASVWRSCDVDIPVGATV